MTQLVCPFCLQEHDFTVSGICDQTGQEVPQRYIDEYTRLEPLWLLTVGFSQHGKTVYLAALTLMLENIASVWKGMFTDPLDQETYDSIKMMRHEAITGEVPGGTVKQVPRPLLLGIYNLPGDGSHCAIMYDLAGEIFDDKNVIAGYAMAIKQVSTIWFLVSLADLEEDGIRRISDLFSVYLDGMRRLRVTDMKNRTMIVVYTKADRWQFPQDIERYLTDDPYCDLTSQPAKIMAPQQFDWSSYVEKMEEVSNQIQQYTQDEIPGGAAFMAMVQAQGINVRFCVTSAIGSSLDDRNKMRMTASRYRVLDPLIWTVQLQRQIAHCTLDQTHDSSKTGAVVTTGVVSLHTSLPKGISNFSPPSEEQIPTQKMKVFLSHSHNDLDKYVMPIMTDLENKGFSVWIDKEELKGGQNWLDEINSALQECDVLVLFVSPRALASKYVRMEYRYFLDEDKPVIPLICEETKLPIELRGIQYIQHNKLDELIEELRFLNQSLLSTRLKNASTSLIGITGRISAGKSRVSRVIAERTGFIIISQTYLINAELAKENQRGPHSFEDIYQYKLRIRKQKGKDYLAKLAFREAIQGNPRGIVIDGLTHPEEIQYLEQNPNFKLLAVVADSDWRWQQFRGWSSFEGGQVDRMYFDQIDRRVLRGLDLNGDPSDFADQIEECICLATGRVVSGVEGVDSQVDAFLSSLPGSL